MLLPYATVKPHDQAQCPLCGPRGMGHYVCQNPACPGRGENNGLGRPAVHQARRHATETEYAALPLAHTPIDGVAHQAVFACDDCAEDLEPFCAHPQPPPEPCPVCGVKEGPCLRRDRSRPRSVRHAARTDPRPEHCTHAHRPDCEVFAGCQCTGDDQPPPRPPHPASNPDTQPDVTRLLFDESAAQVLLQQNGIHWWQVREAASVWTQDTKPGLRAEYATLDDKGHIRYDVHGHEIRETVVIEIAIPPQG